MKKILLSAMVCLFIIGAAEAHEVFVITDAKNPKAGDTIPLYFLSTHYFMVGEELEDIKYNRIYIRQNGTRGAALPLRAVPERMWYQAEFRLQSDAPVIVEADRAATYTTVFTDGTRVEAMPNDAKAANPGKTVAQASYLHKVSKTYLNPNARDTAFSTPLGYDLEIIPLDNPAALRPGSNARFRVLYKGQPLPNVAIWATYDYYDYRTMNGYEQQGKTDSRGEVTFRISSAGIWIVGLRNATTSTVQGVRVAESNDSTVVFTIAK